ncbi:MAG: protein kinase domain-containing protein, partial [Candidatus Promineifilaceae bacterium]
MSTLIGRQIENYRIEALLGDGGMGSVYRAFDVTLARPVALKIMHSQFASQPEFQRRFMQEAQTSARLGDHRHIVNIYSFGSRQSFLYLVMEYVSGGSLGSYLKRLRQNNQIIELREALALIAQVAEGLGYAHRQGVVHRDVKPDNVLLKPLEGPDRPGDLPLRAIVTDFGLAKLLEGGLQTQTGMFMGTLPYMSPEQCLDHELDGRSDLYSLGIMLYQLTTGQLPFDVKSPTDAVQKHLHDAPPDPQQLAPFLPPRVAAILDKAIAKGPAARFQSGEEMAEALRQAAAHAPAGDPGAGRGETVSLATAVATAAVEAPGYFGEQVTALPGEARLLVARRGEEPRVVALYKETLLIGRVPPADVVLADESVSREHARLDRLPSGDLQVMDLDSTNGSYLDNERLVPRVPAGWERGQVLRIGVYFLRLQEAAPAVPAEAPTVLPAREDAFWADMRPRELVNEGVARVLVHNQGSRPARYSLTVSEPAGGLTFEGPAQPLVLAPGERGTIDLSIQAQRRPVLAGRRVYPFEVDVSSDLGGQQTLAGQLTARPGLPAWALALLALVVVLLCVGVFSLARVAGGAGAAATQTAQAGA